MSGFLSDKFRVKKFDKEIEPQEILLDSFARRREQEFEISEKKLEVPLSQKIIWALWLGILVVMFLLFAKTAQLQVLDHGELVRLSEENRFAVSLIQAQRGVIYDKNMNQLVLNKPSFDLVCEGKVKEENLTHEKMIFYQIKINEMAGCEIKNNTVREYLSGSVFAHLLGFERQSNKTGLEAYYDAILQAKPGEIQIKRDVYGNPISQEIVSQPSSGQSLVLYLDGQLQNKIYDVLGAVVRNAGAKGGAAVALDPKTGGVLALVSFPTFDNNLFSQGMTDEQWQSLQSDSRKPLFNRAVSGTYLTGSTIKPLLASAALQEKIIDPQKDLYCPGYISIPNPWVSNASTTKRDWSAHGWTDLTKAIAESCDVYFYTLGGGFGDQEGLGPTRIKQYLELFGWNEKTGIDLPGETAGFLPDKEWKKETWGQSWWDGDTYNFAIGQGFLQISPLEVASSFVAIANGGTLYQPEVVKEVIDDKKNVVQEIEPKIIRQGFIDAQNIQIAREGMRQAVTGFNAPQASSVMLNSLPVSSAAKTGTAELGNATYHNWVTVFAPYDNPEIVLTVMIERVPKEQAAALPVAKEVLNWYFSR